MSQNPDLSAEQLAQAIDHGEECGLAGTIGPDDADKLPGLDLKRDAPQSDILPVGDHGILNIYYGITHFRPAILWCHRRQYQLNIIVNGFLPGLGIIKAARKIGKIQVLCAKFFSYSFSGILPILKIIE